MMPLLRLFLRGWARLRQPQLDAKMPEQTREQLELRAEREITPGLSPDEARRVALRRFGGWKPIKERCRHPRGWFSIEQVFQDVNHAARGLRRSPWFTAVATLALGLGIGANTAIFSLVKSVLLRPLPYPRAEQIVVLWERQPATARAPMPWLNLRDWQEDNRAFTALAGYRRVNYTLTGLAEPELLNCAHANASFFSVIGLPPRLGRVFTDAEDQPGVPGLVVLSDGFWQHRFGGDPAIVGRALTLNGENFTVIGVLPPEFNALAGVELFTQLNRTVRESDRQSRADRPALFAMGRLKPGVGLEAGLADLRRISARIERDDPRFNTGVRAGGQLLFDHTVGDYRAGLWLLVGAVGLVLLIACANLANLLLARAAARENEMAVRAALGASRFRLFRQLLIESLLLAAGGGLLGVLLALWAHDGIAALSPVGVARFQEAGLDGVVFATCAAITFLTALVFGLWPAWKTAQVDLRSALVSGGRSGSAGPAATRARETLIVVEIALTLMLLVGAGLLLKSFARAQAVDLGFQAETILTARVSLPWRSYNSREKIVAFQERARAQIAALPGVRSAELAVNSPLNVGPIGWTNGYVVEGQPAPAVGQLPLAEVNSVSDGYFSTLGIPLLRGRCFGPPDRLGAQRVLIVDTVFAAHHWPGGDALGKSIRLSSETGDRYTIVGIVPTVRLHGYAEEPRLPQAYLCARQFAITQFTLLVQTVGDPAAMTNALREAVRAVDPDQPLGEVGRLADQVSATFATPRLSAFLLSVFAGLALLLATIGLYGVLAYQVSRRTREFGIRLALGALASQISTLVLRRGLRLLTLGFVFGACGALALGRVLGSLLYRTSALDVGVLGGVTALLASVVMLACWLPARRAAKVNPLIALRAE